MWYLAFWIFFVNEQLGLWVEVEAPRYNTPDEDFASGSCGILSGQAVDFCFIAT
jgi:hypothetical protein